MKKSYILGLILLIANLLPVSAQTPPEIEAELIQHLKNIDEWAMKTDRTGEDLSEQLAKEQETFRTKLLDYTDQDATLKYSFPKLANHMHIATSRDGRVRAYSWDTKNGGTMRFFRRVYQYKYDGGITLSREAYLEEGDPGGFVSDIFTFKTNGERYYLMRSTFVFSTSAALEKIEGFALGFVIMHPRRAAMRSTKSADLSKFPAVAHMSRLNSKELFKSDSAKELSYEINIRYDFFSVVNRKTRPIKLIRFNRAAKTLKIPVIAKDDKFPNGKVTNKFVTYRYNGKIFEKLTN